MHRFSFQNSGNWYYRQRDIYCSTGYHRQRNGKYIREPNGYNSGNWQESCTQGYSKWYGILNM